MAELTETLRKLKRIFTGTMVVTTAHVPSLRCAGQQQGQAATRLALGLGHRTVGGLLHTPAASKQKPALRRRLQARQQPAVAARHRCRLRCYAGYLPLHTARLCSLIPFLGASNDALPHALQAPTLVAAAASSGNDAEASSAAAAAPAAGSGHGHGGGRHAFLHDFCMCLPYGALVAAGGLLAKLFGWGQPAVVMMAVGVLQLGLASLSLKVWRQSKSAAPFTLLEAGKCRRLLLRLEALPGI